MSTPLISDRIPFLLIERCKIVGKGAYITAERGEHKTNLPIRNIQLLIIGNGTSITSEAMYICSKERCHLAQSKGGVSIHTVFHSGLYANPQRIMSQVRLTCDPINRLRIAKHIAIKKLQTLQTDASEEIIKIINTDSLSEILGIEGSITKKEYKFLFGDSFQRSFNKVDIINKNMTVLNSVFYSLITSIVLSLGYSPSVGFLHGHTRRGGFVFDIADIFKHKIYLNNIELLNSDKNMARELNIVLQNDKNKIIKEIISSIEEICGGDL